ncbi:MAG: cobalamin-binding protein [Sphingobacteriales bacterium 41-5]|nr:MAG: cobalamin-binding protein [Sphingobacteriales bacterium 41-5]
MKDLKAISLVPSITETLYSLGLNEEVVGITKFCVHPQDWFRTKERVGGTKNIHIQKIRELQPDLIIANKEENVKEQVEELAKDFEVLLTDVNNFEEALQMTRSVGNAVSKGFEADQLTAGIERKFSKINPAEQKTAAYLIWQNPYMTVGGDTFIHEMMKKAGFENIFADTNRYPETQINELKELKPEYLLLSSEPYPFKQKHIDELQQQLPGTKVILVDGEMFSWYGSRMLLAADYFRRLRLSL